MSAAEPPQQFAVVEHASYCIEHVGCVLLQTVPLPLPPSWQ
jgi:hypothetical protein